MHYPKCEIIHAQFLERFSSNFVTYDAQGLPAINGMAVIFQIYTYAKS